MRLLACALMLIASDILLSIVAVGSRRVQWMLAPTWRQTVLVPDDRIGHRGNPAFYVEHDAWGYRNETVPARADIVAIGDSQTYGDGATRDGTWPQQLAELTGQTVYNMGIAGWGAVQYRAVLKQALSLRPRCVIVGLYFGNDLFDAYHAGYHLPAGIELRDASVEPTLQRWERDDPLKARIDDLSYAALRKAPGLPPQRQGNAQSTTPASEASLPLWIDNPLRRYVAEHSRLYGLARACRRAVSPKSAPTVPDEPTWDDWTRWATIDRPEYISLFDSPFARTVFTSPYRGVAVDLDDPRLAEGLNVTFRALEKMQLECAAASAKLIVAVIPTKEFVYQPFVSEPEGHIDYVKLIRNETIARERLESLLRQRTVTLVDTTPSLRDAVRESRSPVYPASPDGHPRRAGYAAIAQTLADHPTVKP